MESNDYYAILGIGKSATTTQIKDAYRKQAFAFHPDRNRDDPEAAAKMKAVNEAYAVLSNPEKRREYDQMRERFGDAAAGRFKQSYSEQDIFSGSDINQVFEEMARAFGVRGFDDIFRELHGTRYRRFNFRKGGLHGSGFFFFGGFGRINPISMLANAGKISRLIVNQMAGHQLPQKGRDEHDVIDLSPDLALKGGPFAYFHRRRSKKLVVKIPPDVKNGQKIRLSGMGETGKGGASDGDLYLKVRIRRPFLERIKKLIKSD